jgi:hypothetical protein
MAAVVCYSAGACLATAGRIVSITQFVKRVVCGNVSNRKVGISLVDCSIVLMGPAVPALIFLLWWLFAVEGSYLGNDSLWRICLATHSWSGGCCLDH